ncbi:MAG TPA: CocE/NonD family hydrolase [Acidimicrobiales bacterium]|nr:CocE/NonD family hydrolase [Acidimicrobiales bacterium]
MRRPSALVLAASALAAVTVAVVPDAAAVPTLTHGCVESVPEPGSTAPVDICWTVFRPEGASPANPVPMLVDSHGWGGSRQSEEGAFQRELGAGFGVISFDQRGFGESGGQAHVEDPDLEGQDVQRIVDVVAGLDWVAMEAPGDPWLGAMGGSYGGGYQMVGAFTELRDKGMTRFDVLAPEITWFDLRDSLAPSGVVRTAWVTALYAAGIPFDAHTTTVHQGFVEGLATGTFPKAMNDFFANNGPAHHVAEGRRLDIPVLIGQGTTDNLFNLNQGLSIYDKALTPEARARSVFVGYNGGHALPNLVPTGTPASGDPCSAALSAGGSFGELRLRFFQEELQGAARSLGGRGLYHVATADGRCITTDSVRLDWRVPLGSMTTPAAAGLPMAVKVADGPITVVGRSQLDALVTTVLPDARVFFALSIGTSPSDAKVIQNNMLPLRVVDPVNGKLRSIELPAVGVHVPAGQSLFLTVSPLSDMSFGHGSRIPNVITLDDAVLRLPVVEG